VISVFQTLLYVKYFKRFFGLFFLLIRFFGLSFSWVNVLIWCLFLEVKIVLLGLGITGLSEVNEAKKVNLGLIASLEFYII